VRALLGAFASIGADSVLSIGILPDSLLKTKCSKSEFEFANIRRIT
jgi:hypothetical protein